MKTCETIALPSRMVSNKRSAACDLDGEMVILNLESGVYFGLNAVGASIWNYLQTERTLEEVVTHLLVEYKVDPERCQSEVVALLQQMAANGLIDVHSHAQAA